MQPKTLCHPNLLATPPIRSAAIHKRDALILEWYEQ